MRYDESIKEVQCRECQEFLEMHFAAQISDDIQWREWIKEFCEYLQADITIEAEDLLEGKLPE